MESPPISQAYYDQLVRLIETFPEAAGTLINANDWKPAPGSQVERERREVPDQEALQTSLSLGEQALEHAADHMFSLSEACMTPVKPFAAFTLARGVLESAMRVLWLLDANIKWDERVTRGMSLRLQNLDSQRWFAARRSEHPDLVVKQIDERVAKMVTQADNMGVTVRRNKSRVTGFGSGMPRWGELTRRIPDGESDYRLFSAVYHGAPWAVIEVGLEKSDRENFAVKSAKPMFLIYLCSRSIEYLAHALWAEVSSYDWNSGPFARLLEETYDSASLPPERRFWRRQATAHI